MTKTHSELDRAQPLATHFCQHRGLYQAKSPDFWPGVLVSMTAKQCSGGQLSKKDTTALLKRRWILGHVGLKRLTAGSGSYRSLLSETHCQKAKLKPSLVHFIAC